MQDDRNSIEYSIWNTRTDPRHKLTKEQVQQVLKSDSFDETFKKRPK